MLYSENGFSFDMLNPYHHKSPPTMLGTVKHHEEWHPSPPRPFISPGDVRNAFYEIERRLPIKALTDWVYYDHFLRWLYCIGPKNAALVKTLKFQGTAKLHNCDGMEMTFPCFFKPCDYSIVDSLRIYMPFIRKFCTGLEKLTLIVEEDNWAKTRPQDIIDEGFPADREAALRPLLEMEIRQIDSLKELIVLGSWKDTEQLDYARPISEFLEKRGEERKRIRIEKAEAWAGAKPFVSGKTECGEKQHLNFIAEGMEKIQVRENAIQIAPATAAAGKRVTKFCRRFRSVLDLRFGEAEKIEVAHSYFRTIKR
jgi:hypothetical protein